MIDFTIERDIACAANDVFAYITDPHKLPSWQTNTVRVERLDEGPLRVGSRLREVHRGPGGKELESVVEVDTLDPGRAFGLRIVEGALPVHAHITLSPDVRGTRVRFRVYGQPRGAMRLLQPLLRPVLRKQFDAHCDTLRARLEAAG